MIAVRLIFRFHVCSSARYCASLPTCASSSAHAEPARPRNQPLFRCLVHAGQYISNSCRILAPTISQRATFPVAVELPGGQRPSARHARRAALRSVATTASRSTAASCRPSWSWSSATTRCKSEEAAKGAAPTELPFINVQRYLARAGVAVPAIYRYDAERGLIYLEDLGDVTFESRVRRRRRRRAARATTGWRSISWSRCSDTRPRIPIRAASRSRAASTTSCSSGSSTIFASTGSRRRGITLTPAEREERRAAVSRSIAERLAAEPRGFVHRDYQSRNLMVQDEPTGRRGCASSIFRMRCSAPRAYDLVGLLARHLRRAFARRCSTSWSAITRERARLDDARFQRAVRSADRAAQAQGRRPLRLHRPGEEESRLPGAHSEQPRVRRALDRAAARAGATLREILSQTLRAIRVSLSNWKHLQLGK